MISASMKVSFVGCVALLAGWPTAAAATPEAVQPLLISNSAPAWSPNSQHIALQSSDAAAGTTSIWLIHPDQSGLERITDGLSPAWASDCLSLYFQRLHDTGVWKRNLSSGAEAVVASTDVKGYAVSHSGDELILDVTRGEDSALIIASALTGADLRWFATYGYDPAWSPDDTAAVYGMGGNLWIRSTLDRGGRRQLTSLTTDVAFSASNCDWSANGFIAFDYNGDVYKIRPDGTDISIVFDEPNEDGLSSDPSWSPDGSRIAFTRLIESAATSQQEIWIINADGTGLTQLTHTVEIPHFSPEAGTYTGAQSVGITTGTAGTQIRYTTDGSEPTENSTLYTGPVSVTSSIMVRARAWKSGWFPSTATAAEYVIQQSRSEVEAQIGGQLPHLVDAPVHELQR